MSWLNDVTGWFALLWVCLAMRGFFPGLMAMRVRSFRDLREIHRTPADVMTICVMVLCFKSFLRMGYAYIYLPIAFGTFDNSIHAPLATTVIGVILNVFAALSALGALWALYLSIPDDERHKYNLITAAFYPSPLCWCWFRREKHDER